MWNKLKQLVKEQKTKARVSRISIWWLMFPGLTFLVTGLWVLFANNAVARNMAINTLNALAHRVDFIPILPLTWVLLAAGLIVYFLVDYKQHAHPLKLSFPEMHYAPFHHLKKVVLPRMQYNWWSSTKTLSYITAGMTIVVVALSMTLSVQPVRAYAANEFVTTWKTDNPGGTGSNQLSIPLNYQLSYNFTVDWGDGTVESGQTNGNNLHTYATPGTYTVKITGLFPAIRTSGGGDSKKLLTVEQWGTNQWASMNGAFAEASNMAITATDAPNLSNVTDMSEMFQYATSFNQSIDHWNVSNVRYMSRMFYNATSFNQPLNNWDVSNVTTTSRMFTGATSFNQPLNNWDVSNVIDMSAMFGVIFYADQTGQAGATSFNQPLNNWNVSSVTDMDYMFARATSFNQDINSWDTSSVTRLDQTFSNATSFNQPIGAWDVSNVTTMTGLFRFATSFNQNINNWDVSSVGGVSNMFQGATSFNQPLNNWDVSNLNSLFLMFQGATSFNQNINNWDVSSVAGLYGVFDNATSFNQPLNNWNVSNVTDMTSMFQGATSFDRDLSSWNIQNVTEMPAMFADSSLSSENYDALLVAWSELPLQSNVFFGANNVTYCSSSNARNILTGTYNWTIEDGGRNCSTDAFITTWKTDNPGSSNSNQITIPTNGSGYNYTVDWGDGNTSSGLTGSATHTYASPGVYQTRITGSYPRRGYDSVNSKKLLSIDQWGIIQWDNMAGAFDGASNMQLNATDAPDLSNVTNMTSMFAYATSFNQPLNNWDVSSVTNMSFIFVDATSFNQSLASWDISNVTNLYGALGTSQYPSGISTANYDSALIAWSNLNLKNNVNLNSSAHYCNSEEERQGIIDSFNWVIADAGKFCDVPFITTWKTDNPGSSNSNQITIPTNGSGYNYTVDWGDGNTSSGLTGSATHTYASPGTYEVEITGDFPRIYFNGEGDRQKILTVEQWGTNIWKSMSHAFHGATNLTVPAEDAPDLLDVTDLNFMFAGATSFNQPVGHWDVSSVRNMASVFEGATSFNQPLNDWTLLYILDINSIFKNATSFNQDINSWFSDVQVHFFNRNMSYMFAGATSFNQDINDWYVGGTINMQGMFQNATSFNQPLGNWEPTGNLVNMSYMFAGATSFNQDINAWGESAQWYTPGQDFSHMFAGATSFNQDLDLWYLGNGGNLSHMFAGATAFNGLPPYIDSASGTDFSYMFAGATSFNQSVEYWYTTGLVSAKGMFQNATSFNQPLTYWDVYDTTDMSYMFAGATSFNQDISSLDVSNVTDMSGIFTSSALSSENYDALLNSWANLALQNDVPFDTDTSYCTGADARALIVNSFNWIFNDGGEDCLEDPLVIDTASPLEHAVFGSNYDNTIETSGGADGVPVDFSIVGGSLPKGIKLNSNSGSYVGLVGYPYAPGTYTFDLKAERASSYTNVPYYSVTKTFSLTVDPTPAAPSFTPFSAPFVTLDSTTRTEGSSVDSVALTGTGPADKMVEIYRAGTYIGGVRVGLDGNWTYQAQNTPKGDQAFTAKWEPSNNIAFMPVADSSNFSSRLIILDSSDRSVVKSIAMPAGYTLTDAKINQSGTKVYVFAPRVGVSSVAAVLEYDITTGLFSKIVDVPLRQGIGLMSLSPDGTVVYVNDETKVVATNIATKASTTIDISSINDDVYTLDGLSVLLGGAISNTANTKLFLAFDGYSDNEEKNVLVTVDLQNSTVDIHEDTGGNEFMDNNHTGFAQTDSNIYVYYSDGTGSVLNQATGAILRSFDLGLDSYIDYQDDLYDVEKVIGATYSEDSNTLYFSVNRSQGSYVSSEDRTSTDSLQTFNLQNDSVGEHSAPISGTSLAIDETTNTLLLANTSLASISLQSNVAFTSFNLSNFTASQVDSINGFVGYKFNQGKFAGIIASPQASLTSPGGSGTVGSGGGPSGGSGAGTVEPGTNNPAEIGGAGAGVAQEPGVAAVEPPLNKILGLGTSRRVEPRHPNVVQSVVLNIAKRLGVSQKFVVIAFPWLIVLILSLFALTMLYKIIHQLALIKKMRQLVSRQALLNHEKRSLLSLATHYLRTPLTILVAGMEVLPDESISKAKIQSAVEELKLSINSVVQKIEGNQNISEIWEPQKPLRQRASLLQPGLIIPVIVVAVLMIVLNLIAVFAAKINPGLIQLISQVVGFLFVVGLLYSFYDIHTQKKQIKQYENRLLEYQETLDHTRNQFIRDVSNKLVPAIIAVDSTIPPGLPEEATKYFKEGLRQLEHTSENFILISQLEKSKLQQKASQVQITDAIENARQNLKNANALLTVKVPETTSVNQPEFLMRKVISSIIDNATEHSNTTMATEITSNQTADQVRVGIKDRGEGISKEKLSLLFKPLSRVEEAEDFTHQGMGLSLFVSRLIMHYLGGEISAESVLGKGTTMSLSIPTKLT